MFIGLLVRDCHMSGKNMGRSELLPLGTRELPYWASLSGCLTRYSTHGQVT